MHARKKQYIILFFPYILQNPILQPIIFHFLPQYIENCNIFQWIIAPAVLHQIISAIVIFDKVMVIPQPLKTLINYSSLVTL